MFIGHYGVAYALKPADRQLSLGLLFLAVQFVDVLWAVFVLAGVERVNIVGGGGATPLDFVYYPFTHSLAAAIVWSAAAYAFFSLKPATRRSPRGTAALVLAIAVLSHFALDLVVHRPDLPLAPGDSPKLGLGLWDYPWIAWSVELILFLAGLRFYLKSSRAVSGRGRWGTAMVVLFLLSVHTMTMFGPPPANIAQVSAVGLSTYLVAGLLGWWADRGRV